MKQPDTAPARWLEQPEQVSPELGQALAAYRDRAPAAPAREAMFAGLQRQLATGAAPRAHWLRRLWLPVALGGLVALLAVLARVDVPPRGATSSNPGSSDAPPRGTASSPGGASAEPPAVLDPAPAQTSPHAPAAPASAAPEALAPPPAPDPKARRPASDPSAELALLAPARRVLPADPARSLELAAEHARRFPRGAFAEERDLLRIEALLGRGQRALAARHARRFRLSYPRSAHLEHLAELLTP